MASFQEMGGFDANQVEPQRSDVIPAGDYDVVITESKWEATKKNDGKYLKLKLQIISGPYQNRYLFDQLNLVNKNAQAVQIAKAALSSICRAVGVLTPGDSAELHMKPLKVTVKVESNEQYGTSNRIKAYKSRHVGAPTPPPVPPTPAHAAAQQPAGGIGSQQTPW